MTFFKQRDPHHITVKLLLCLSAALAVVGCSSGISGHAPGLAGQQSQDPGTFTYPLAYIKRPFPAKDINAADLITSTTGGDVFVREQASAGAVETNITLPITGGQGDVRDLDVSVDGKLLIFSLRAPLDPKKANDDVTQPTWKIYQYDATAKSVTQLTNDDTTAGHDVGAHYLPDGRIVFSSTRQAATQSLLVDEGDQQFPAQSADAPKQPIFLLHVMNADGSNIHQISFNTNHDFAPAVLTDGTIVFSRYDGGDGGHISLYHAHEDGTGLELYYGANSHATGYGLGGSNSVPVEFLNARQRPDGQLLVIARPFQGTQLGGDILRIDAQNYVECNQAATANSANGTCALARPGQSSVTMLGVTNDMNQASLAGRFASVYPLYDGSNRLLVSWSPCFVLDATVTPTATRVCTATNIKAANVKLAPPSYTLWVYDMSAGTLSPLLAAQSGLMIVEPVVLQARTPVPQFDPDTVPTGAAGILATNTNAPLGLLQIRSVYDFDGIDVVATQTNGAVSSIAALADPKVATADQRPARFIRVEKAVEIPGETVRKLNPSAFGPTDMGMREILGYAPVEPDGSVKIQVPANVPFTIEILDKNARRINVQQHASWMQLLPGETKTCNGCHVGGSTVTPSHGRTGLTTSVNSGAVAAGTLFPDTVAFPAALAGDTMAAARAGSTCASGTATACSELPTTDVLYTDVWTNPAISTVNPPISYLYADLTTPHPTNAHCLPWDPLCRSSIEYPLQIQPLWNFVRQTTVAAVTTDHTCVLCHNKVDAANTVQAPAGQLDLTDSASTVDTTVNTSYEQLLFAHDEQELNMGVLQDVLVPGPPDPVTGLPTSVTVPVSLAPPMVAGSANGSKAKFFSVFDGTYQDQSVGQPGYVDHTNFLTPAELRLISEWLDIGAQYYNNPFVAPAAN